MDSTGPAGYLTLTAAAERSGLARQTLSGRVKLGLLPAYSDPKDRRYVLLKVADLDGLNTPRPRPVAATRGEAAVG